VNTYGTYYCVTSIFLQPRGGPLLSLVADPSLTNSQETSSSGFSSGTVALAAMLAAAGAAILTVSIILIIRYARRQRVDSSDVYTRHAPGSKFYGTVAPSTIYGSVTSKLSKPEDAVVAVGSGS